MELVATPIMGNVMQKRRRFRREEPLTPGTSPDGRLAARVAAGDVDALREVHERYGPAVFGLLRRTLRDEMTAEDVFQQVMTEVWQRAGAFDPARASFSTWLLTLARSRAIDELRRRRPDPVDPATIADTSPVTDPGYEESLQSWVVADILGRLPDDERELLAMRVNQDLSQSEIAERTGLPIGTVKTRMTRGLERLRTMLDDEGLTQGGAR